MRQEGGNNYYWPRFLYEPIRSILLLYCWSYNNNFCNDYWSVMHRQFRMLRRWKSCSNIREYCWCCMHGCQFMLWCRSKFCFISDYQWWIVHCFIFMLKCRGKYCYIGKHRKYLMYLLVCMLSMWTKFCWGCDNPEWFSIWVSLLRQSMAFLFSLTTRSTTVEASLGTFASETIRLSPPGHTCMRFLQLFVFED